MESNTNTKEFKNWLKDGTKYSSCIIFYLCYNNTRNKEVDKQKQMSKLLQIIFLAVIAVIVTVFSLAITYITYFVPIN